MNRGRALRRGGFSLIELLVAISIIALLAALVASGVQIVRTSQMAKATELGVSKVQQGITKQWSAELDTIRAKPEYKNPPDALMNYAGGDIDRARSLIVFAEMKVRFPQTFVEARSPVSLPGYTAQPLAIFSKVPNTSTGDAVGESAHLLFLMLSQKSARGQQFTPDDVASVERQIPSGGPSYTVFKDGYGTPLTFVRYVQNQEVDGYANAKTPFRDQFDVLDASGRGKLALWTGPNRTDAEARLRVGLAIPPSFSFGNTNSSQFRMPSVISAGPNKIFEGVGQALGNTDDVYGYRLVRLDAKGS